MKISKNAITKLIVTSIIFLITSEFARLQESGVIDTIEVRTNRISYTDKLGIYIYGINKYSNFQFKENGQHNDSVLKYRPNGNFNLGAGFSYKWLGIGAAFNIGLINHDDALKGNTSSLDFQVDIYSKRFITNANLQFYEGYYWSNPQVFYPEWSIKDSLVVRPDISTITLGVNSIFILNHNRFSFKAAYQFSERQLKSAGSMLIGARFSLYGVSADSSFVPVHLHEFYPKSTDIGGLSSISLGASFGYTYTFVFGKYFFVNALLMTGLNSQIISVHDLSDEELASASKLSLNLAFRIALGVNKPKAYYGMNFTSDSFLIRNPNDTELSYAYGKFRIYYGRRFNMKKN